MFSFYYERWFITAELEKLSLTEPDSQFNVNFLYEDTGDTKFQSELFAMIYTLHYLNRSYRTQIFTLPNPTARKE